MALARAGAPARPNRAAIAQLVHSAVQGSVTEYETPPHAGHRASTRRAAGTSRGHPSAGPRRAIERTAADAPTTGAPYRQHYYALPSVTPMITEVSTRLRQVFGLPLSVASIIAVE